MLAHLFAALLLSGRDAVLPAGGTDNALPRRCPDLARHVRAHRPLPSVLSLSCQGRLCHLRTRPPGTRQKLPGPFPSGIHLLRKRLSLSGGGPARRLPSPEKALSRSAAVFVRAQHGLDDRAAVPFQIRFPLAGRGAVRHRRTQSCLPRGHGAVPGTSSPPRARCTAPLAFIR